jgi:hypothetical protein
VSVAIAVLIVIALAAAAVRRWRRRTVYLRMSDRWLRDHVADPLPDHLR